MNPKICLDFLLLAALGLSKRLILQSYKFHLIKTNIRRFFSFFLQWWFVIGWLKHRFLDAPFGKVTGKLKWEVVTFKIFA